MGNASAFLQISFFTGMVCSACFALLLLLINIPNSQYTVRLRTTKTLIALCFLACAAVFWFTISHSDLQHFPEFASMMMVVITGISASTLSYSLINLLDENRYSRDAFYLTIGAAAVFSVVVGRLFLHGSKLAWQIASGVYVLMFIVQCVVHIVLFAKVFSRSVRKLESYYDEDEEHKLSWIRFCYLIMMLTQMFVLVYFILGFTAVPSMIGVYALWYCLFMLYFTSNFISFLSTHKIMLDAFAHNALTIDPRSRNTRRAARKAAAGGRESALTHEGEAREREFRALEASLRKWVAEKRYREYDRSREDIAEELGTSKEILQLYFALRKGIDFRTWRTNLRIEDAKTMLLEDRESPVQVIAELSGFSDRSNFHRQFTKTVGCSPKEWRDRNAGCQAD